MNETLSVNCFRNRMTPFLLLAIISLLAPSTQGSFCNFYDTQISCSGVTIEAYLYLVKSNAYDIPPNGQIFLEISDSKLPAVDLDDLLKFDGNVENLDVLELKISNSSLKNVVLKRTLPIKRLRLDLNHNEIDDISFFRYLPKELIDLDMSNNKITELDLEYFHMEYVENLNFSNNLIKSIKPAAYSLSYGYIDLSNNKLIEFNEYRLNCFFKSVDLSYNLLKTYEARSTDMDKVKLTGNTLSLLGSNDNQFFSSHELYLSNIPNTSICVNKLVLSKTKTAILDLKNLRVCSKNQYRSKTVSTDFFDISYNQLNSIEITSQQLKYFSLNLKGNHLKSFDIICSGIEMYKLDVSMNKIDAITTKTFQRCSKVTNLDASENKIKSIAPGSLSHMKDLHIFNLSYNHLSSIKSQTFNSLLLSELYLQGNSLSSIKRGVFTFKNLKVLDLSKNGIKNLDSGAFSGVFDILDLSNNSITNLAGVFINCIIGELRLSNNNIKNIQANYWDGIHVLIKLNLAHNNLSPQIQPGMFRGLKSLKVLNLAYNNYKIIENDSFQDLVNLETLLLNDNQLEELPIQLPLPKLKTLHLHSNHLTKLACNVFVTPLLETLRLDQNRFKVIKTGYFGGIENLKSLNLSNNYYSGNYIFGKYSDAVPITTLTKLTYLGLADVKLHQDFDYAAIIRIFKNLDFIRVNDFSFSCDMLSKMLQVLDVHGIDYSPDVPVYMQNNIKGIGCSDHL